MSLCSILHFAGILNYLVFNYFTSHLTSVAKPLYS